jgi:NADH-quinone oxidoreductase subunit N
MSAFPSTTDLLLVLPELIWCGFGALLMLLQPFVRSRKVLTFVAVVGALLGIMGNFYAVHNPGSAFSDLVAADPFSIFFSHLVGLVAVLVILAAAPYLDRERLADAEFYALVLFATAGMGVLASAQELLTAFIGLELSSISSYILAGYRRDTLKSGESSMKYFLLGSFATAFFLYGIALVYGVTGTTNLLRMNASDPTITLLPSPMLKLGLALILIGLGFKVAAAPFQIWTPDVYEGAPTPVTALFSAGPKAAAFALLLRIFADVHAATQFWFWAFWIMAVLTMFAGNLGALLQTNVKRLLAYSSIAHAGYVLVAVAARSETGTAAAMFYLAAYALMNVGAFAVVTHLSGKGERFVSVDDFAGLAERQPFTAALLTVFLLSLIGVPLTGGFFGKFYIFKAALESHLVWLTVLGLLNSAVAAYYYLRILVVMYMHEPSEAASAAEPLSAGMKAALVLPALGTFFLGIFPSALLIFAGKSAVLVR